MRSADAAARGSITNIAVTMNTENRICIAYCSDGDHRADLHLPGVDADGAEPDDRHGW